jgi:hypothetical protein
MSEIRSTDIRSTRGTFLGRTQLYFIDVVGENIQVL